VLAIAVLLLVLALQVVIAIRRDRRLSRDRHDDYEDDRPAYIEDEDDSEYGVDALGDVDDLQVHDYSVPVPVAVAVHQADDDTGELPAVGGEVEYYEEEGDWGDESDDVAPEQEEEPAEPEEPEEPEEPGDEPEPPPPPVKKTTKRPRKR
jgi:hypothetical protein